MRLTEDRSPGAFTVFVSCIRCGASRSLAEVATDQDGPPFHAHFCARPNIGHDCRPVSTADAEAVYNRHGWGKALGWRHCGT